MIKIGRFSSQWQRNSANDLPCIFLLAALIHISVLRDYFFFFFGNVHAVVSETGNNNSNTNNNRECVGRRGDREIEKMQQRFDTDVH